MSTSNWRSCVCVCVCVCVGGGGGGAVISYCVCVCGMGLGYYAHVCVRWGGGGGASHCLCIRILPQELPEQWNNVKKQAVIMKQDTSAHQVEEANNIRRKLASFDVRQHQFRERFRNTAPFQFDATHPYVRLNKVRN